MAPSKRPRKHPPSLSHGRPLTIHKQPANLSSRTTRTKIRTHHTLSKSLSRALAANDTALAASLSPRLDLAAYQAASLTAQSLCRGGDTSRALLAFLRACAPGLFSTLSGKRRGAEERLRMLDVGALATDTAAARSGLFEVTRIDLHSQAKGIEEQDFMERPLPRGPGERFDVVCLSLVLNFCPEARGRGQMLRRVCEFLVAPPATATGEGEGAAPGPFPALFLVLPAPCVTNSRYLNQERLALIMQSLGFRLVEMKVSAKLAYYLWRWIGAPRERVPFAKREMLSGGNRNNFAIVLE